MADRIAYILVGALGVIVGAVIVVNESAEATYGGGRDGGYVTGWLIIWAGSLAVLVGVIATGVLVGLRESGEAEKPVGEAPTMPAAPPA
jgi:hypothetical protein